MAFSSVAAWWQALSVTAKMCTLLLCTLQLEDNSIEERRRATTRVQRCLPGLWSKDLFPVALAYQTHQKPPRCLDLDTMAGCALPVQAE